MEQKSEEGRKQRIDRLTRLMKRFRMDCRFEIWRKIALLPALENNGERYISANDLKKAIFDLDGVS